MRVTLTDCSHEATVERDRDPEDGCLREVVGRPHGCEGRARVLARIERLAGGNPGDVQPVGEGVSELRVDYGPGYRVYFKRRGSRLVILLAGGDKRSQARDIKRAQRLARDLSE